jgi:4a-hydroxytetrahydrobiopterin dehydratase
LNRPELLDASVVESWTAVHDKWRVEESHLVREFETTAYANGSLLIQLQVPLAERLNHHPVVTLEYRRVRFVLWTHDRGGLTQLDLDYAEGLDALVADVDL